MSLQTKGLARDGDTQSWYLNRVHVPASDPHIPGGRNPQRQLLGRMHVWRLCLLHLLKRASEGVIPVRLRAQQPMGCRK